MDQAPMVDFRLLQQATPKMLAIIQEHFHSTNQKVQPEIKPGFLRKALPHQAPQDGESVEHLLERTRKAILPGIQNWQSPRYYGYFPCNSSSSIVLAEILVSVFQCPSFNFAVSPSFTELQNTMMDWTVTALGLPHKFLLKNSGGGIINNTASESIVVSIHMAKHRKLKERGVDRSHPDSLKLVGYYGQGSHNSSKRGLMIKDVHYQRAAPYIYDPQILNYRIDLDMLQEMLKEDIANGLIPFWFGASYGTTFSLAIDIEPRLVQICSKYCMWLNLDAAFLGAAWVCQHLRPKDPSLLDHIDSIQINYSKYLFNGMGASLFFIADKRLISQSFGEENPEFTLYRNQYSGEQDVVDYKDWTLGLGRRNNSLKLYYFYTMYGLKHIRNLVRSQEEKADYFVGLIRAHPEVFHIHTYRFLTVLFQIRGEGGEPSSLMTKEVAAITKNIREGFSTPAQFLGTYVLRVVVGTPLCQRQHLDLYFGKILETAQSVRKNSAC